VEPARAERAAGKFTPSARFTAVMGSIKAGMFGAKGEFDELLSSLEGNEGFGRGDYFLVAKDFDSYIDCQAGGVFRTSTPPTCCSDEPSPRVCVSIHP